MSNCYTVKIHYRAKAGSDRERWCLEAAKEYGCNPDTHLFDKLLKNRYDLFQAHKEELAQIAIDEALIAERKKKAFGGKL